MDHFGLDCGPRPVRCLGHSDFRYERFSKLLSRTRQTVANDQLSQPKGKTCFTKKGYKEWSADACFIAHSGIKPITLLWGDSHANHYCTAIQHANPPIAGAVLMYASAGCLP
ncbi:SGNH hydrolase domain-containing protein [Sphingomonas sp. MMS24-JH45]